MLKELLLSALLTQTPPGVTKYSLEPDGAGGFRQESAATAKVRYGAITEAMVDAARAKRSCRRFSARRT